MEASDHNQQDNPPTLERVKTPTRVRGKRALQNAFGVTVKRLLSGDRLSSKADSEFQFRILYQKHQLLDFYSLVATLMSNFLALVQAGYEIQESNYSTSVALLTCSSCLELISSAITYLKATLILQQLKCNGLVSRSATLWSVGLFRDMCITWFILLMQPYPFLIGIRVYMYNDILKQEPYYHVNDFLQMMGIFRVILILKKSLALTSWRSNSSYRICSMYGCTNSDLFAVKCLIKKRPMTVILLCMMVLLFTFGHIVRICENPLDRMSRAISKHTYVNSIWEVILTITTIGYGEIYPRTTLGRLVMVSSSFIGALTISTMVVTVISWYQMGSLETKAFVVTEKFMSKKTIKALSEQVLAKWFKLSRQPKAALALKDVYELKAILEQLREQVLQYKRMRDPNMNDMIASELEVLINTQKEIQLYVALLCKLIFVREADTIEQAVSQDDQKLTNVMLELLESPESQKLLTELITKVSQEYKENKKPDPTQLDLHSLGNAIASLIGQFEASPNPSQKGNAPGIQPFGIEKLLKAAPNSREKVEEPVFTMPDLD